jgi:hypothetical protein
MVSCLSLQRTQESQKIGYCVEKGGGFGRRCFGDSAHVITRNILNHESNDSPDDQPLSSEGCWAACANRVHLPNVFGTQ